jgi:carbon-monoxide dehydrogenase large subunit
MRAEGRYFGLGISSGCELTGPGATWYAERGVPISSQEACHVRVDPGGKVHVQLGTTAQGQGIGTAIAQVVADELGVPMVDVTVSMGDTESAPHGGGAWGSRQAMLGGAAAVVGTRRIRDKVLKIAGWLMEANPEDLEMNEGRAKVRGDPRSGVTLKEIAETAYYKTAHLPPEMEPALEETAHFEPPASTHSNAAHATIVEIDADTGRIEFQDYVIVQDSGVIINPLIVAGQLCGATAQGIGGVVHERVVYDESGQPQATTLMDYLLPSSHDVPDLRIEYMETRAPDTPLGAKGVGESGTCFAPAAVATAVADALEVDLERFAFSPSDVHALLVKAGIV